ncbi:MAG TPA: trehalase family glycosidase, partial [Oscillospiraceae bacterium]|nr:trehalase family glycosidase [Oscillospiraceae bacterium]
VMRARGIFTEQTTGKQYFTGYSYETLYDWDQYFESIIQLYLGWDTRYPKNGVEIFLDLQKPNGHIQRSSTGCDAQLSEHIKPFLAQICLLIYRKDGNLDFLTAEYYSRMKKYLNYWLCDRDPNRNGLSVWDSGPHTGMDNQHERVGWWHDCFCEGVDLNAYLVRECRAFARVAEIKGHPDDAAEFAATADRVALAVQQYCWNEEDGYFYDLDQRTGQQIKIKSIASYAVLWAGIATPGQAKRMVEEHLTNPAEFYRPLPFPALAANDSGYTEEKLPKDLGCGWRAQTWVPTNYYVFHGLHKYGYHTLASEVAEKTFQMVKEIGDREYFNTESRTGNGLNPFWGWTLLAYFMPLEDRFSLDPTEIGPDLSDAFDVTAKGIGE